MTESDQDAYAEAGVSQRDADASVEALVRSLKLIDTGKPSRVVPLPNHYASVLRVGEQPGRRLRHRRRWNEDARRRADERLHDDRHRLHRDERQRPRLRRRGADRAARLHPLPRGEPGDLRRDRRRPAARRRARRGRDPRRRDRPGRRHRLRNRSSAAARSAWSSSTRSSTAAAVEPGDALIGLPSSGLHSNGYTLARKVLFSASRARRRPPRTAARRGPPRADRDLRPPDPRAARLPGRASAGWHTSPATGSTTSPGCARRSATRSPTRSTSRRYSS